MNIFIDIDGTLTDNGEKAEGNPNIELIEKVKLLCKDHCVTVWSGRGKQYAKDFCVKHRIIATNMLAKPDVIIDDNPTIRPDTSMKIITPEEGLKL